MTWQQTLAQRTAERMPTAFAVLRLDRGVYDYANRRPLELRTDLWALVADAEGRMAARRMENALEHWAAETFKQFRDSDLHKSLVAA